MLLGGMTRKSATCSARGIVAVAPSFSVRTRPQDAAVFAADLAEGIEVAPDSWTQGERGRAEKREKSREMTKKPRVRHGAAA